MNRWKFWTGRLLLVSGSFLLLAACAVFMPKSVMAATHEWLGLGEMPMDAISIYLARSTSMLYAVHGVVTIYTGLKIETLWPMVSVLGGLHVAMGLTLLFIDLNAGMPIFWTAMEGAPVAALGCGILYLFKRGS